MKQRSGTYRVWHRWLSLVLGVQMVIWAISGAYMVIVQLPFIHGVHLTQESDQPLPASPDVSSLAEVTEKFPHTTEAELVNRLVDGEHRLLWQLRTHFGDRLVDAVTLEPVKLRESDILALAESYYAYQDAAQVKSIQLLTTQAPTELNPAHLPIWRIDFDDFGRTALYLDQTTGEMKVRRHDFWRGFDIMWMLHIMDYKDRTDITTWWLRIFIFGTFGFIFTGIILLIQTLFSSRRKLT